MDFIVNNNVSVLVHILSQCTILKWMLMREAGSGVYGNYTIFSMSPKI